jgi:plasmid maintenance system antidote protein VapI
MERWQRAQCRNRYFGIDAQFWLNLQSEYDLRLAKRRHFPQIRKEVHPLAA